MNFQENLNNELSKIFKTIGLLRVFQAFLPRQSLVTVYKTFIRPHIDYGNITGPIRVTSSEKIELEKP